MSSENMQESVNTVEPRRLGVGGFGFYDGENFHVSNSMPANYFCSILIVTSVVSDSV